MAYVENPIVEGKDFESIATDVNGNFEDIKNEISQTRQAFSEWEFIGETDIVGKATSNGGDFANRFQGKECGSISCKGGNYEKLLLILTGSIDSRTHLKTNMFLITSSSNTSYVDLDIGEQIYYNMGGSKFTNLSSSATTASGNYNSSVTFYWNYYDSDNPLTETNVNIKLYGLKKSQWLLDALETT